MRKKVGEYKGGTICQAYNLGVLASGFATFFFFVLWLEQQ